MKKVDNIRKGALVLISLSIIWFIANILVMPLIFGLFVLLTISLICIVSLILFYEWLIREIFKYRKLKRKVYENKE